jgi:tripartite-type tricarboxylate transporter receptor subunit TctC
MKLINALKSFAAFALVAAAPTLALAQADNYPSRDIHIISSQAAGSGADTIVRFYANKIQEMSKRTVIVENRQGAFGLIAFKALADAKPDGYTLYMSAGNSLASAPHLYHNMTIDPLKQFTQVTSLSKFAFMLVVPKESPYNDVKSLIEGMKKKPDHGLYGATATSGVISSELLKVYSGMKTTQVSYKSSREALTDLMANQIDWMFMDPIAANEHIRAGRIKGLSVAMQDRLGSMPDIPSMKDSGFPEIDVVTWWTVTAPAGTPKPIIDKIAGWVNEVTNSAEGKEFLNRNGMDPFVGTPESANALVRSDSVKWKDYITKAGIEKQ